MPSQAATAYVQIIPSAQGIGNGIARLWEEMLRQPVRAKALEESW